MPLAGAVVWGRECSGLFPSGQTLSGGEGGLSARVRGFQGTVHVSGTGAGDRGFSTSPFSVVFYNAKKCAKVSGLHGHISGGG